MSDMTKSNQEENVKYEEVDHEDITVTEDVFVESDLDFRDVSYDTLQVAKLLGVQESTVRKYCALLVKQGYQFNKNSVGHRIFYKCDVDVMKDRKCLCTDWSSERSKQFERQLGYCCNEYSH